MGVLLEAVTLDDWRAVVNNAKTLAQAGDPQARVHTQQPLSWDGVHQVAALHHALSP